MLTFDQDSAHEVTFKQPILLQTPKINRYFTNEIEEKQETGFTSNATLEDHTTHCVLPFLL